MAHNSTTDYDYRIYMLVAGEAGVGKSTLAQHAEYGTFDPDSPDLPTTLGIDYVKVQRILRLTDAESRARHGDRVTSVDVELFIKDIPGDRRMAPVFTSFFRGLHVVALVYDVSRRSTYESLHEYWWPLVQQYCMNHPVILVLGNKAELPREKHMVSEAEAAEWARSIGAEGLYMCSARYWGHDALMKPLDVAAMEVVMAMQRKPASTTTNTTSSFVLGPRTPERASDGCCSSTSSSSTSTSH